MTTRDIDEFIESGMDKLDDRCKNCFCNDLCVYVVLKAGILTSCSDWQNRVRKVVDREIEKQSQTNQ